MAESQANENTCVVCFKNVLYYSIGECDHPVCFECSTRMRVLCLQNECPICRQDLSRVVFTDSIQTYKELANRMFNYKLFDRQFKIGFSNEEIKNAYDNLLQHCCKICDQLPSFRVFSMLNDHMRKVHERYFCDLCVKHLKIFTIERKCYTRQELAHHRRRGDLDDTSHRGHPLCEFCEERFMDDDERYRHLRKEHLYCHLCDADGKNLYYASHSALAQHFRTDHYLCEEAECAGEHLTSVFRSEIDLKAHKATVHGRGLARGASRQARTLELQFNITPHPVAQRTPRDRTERGDRGAERGEVRTVAEVPIRPVQRVEPNINTGSDEHFPRLSATPAAPNLKLNAPPVSTYKGTDKLLRNDRNFPALDGGNPARQPSRPANQSTSSTPNGSSNAPATVAATIVRNSKPSVSIQLHSQPASASNFRLTQTSGNRISIPPQQKKVPLSDDDFPSLSIGKDDHPSVGAAVLQPPKVTLINSQEMQAFKNNQSNTQLKKPHKVSSEAFPALSATTTPASPPQWITVSKSKEKQKAVQKPDPAPLKTREINFNQVADFPNLPINHNSNSNNNNNNNKPKNKKTIPVQLQPYVQKTQQQPQDEPKSTKKEKKKQNTKKENFVEIPLVNGLDKKYARDPSFSEVNLNNNQVPERDRKIKTVETISSVTIDSERNKNGGTSDFAITSTEYPPLNAKNDVRDYPPLNPKNDVSNFTPVQVKKSNNVPVKKIPNGSVPPGFKKRPACDGLTFTNSAGQTFSAPVHKYIPPPDFENRNRALVKKFAAALGDPETVEDFKVASRAFRDSIISAEEFYEHCRTALGSQFEEVFPDMVALLPDIGKQQELVVGKNITQMDVCSVCGQLLTATDRIVHDTAHWPPLAPR